MSDNYKINFCDRVCLISSCSLKEILFQDLSYEMDAFASHKPLWQLSGSSWAGPTSQVAPFQRGTSTNPAQKEKQEETTPVWIIRKSASTSEPKYRIPKLRNMDGPWRRPVAELSTKQANQDVAESTPIQVQEAAVLGFEIKNRGTEESSHLSEASESSEASFEAGKVTQESSETHDDTQDQVHGTKGTQPSEGFRPEDKEGPECSQELSENRRDVSQVHLRGSLVTPEKPCESDNEIKFVTVLGKKKKSKKISKEGKNK